MNDGWSGIAVNGKVVEFVSDGGEDGEDKWRWLERDGSGMDGGRCGVW